MSFNSEKELERKIDRLLYKVKKNGRKSIGKVVYGSAIMNVIFLLLQIFFIYLILRYWMYSTAFLIAYLIMGIGVVLFIVNEEINPMYKLAWIIPVIAIPIYGTFAYLFMRMQPRTIKMRKNIRILQENVKKYLVQEDIILQEIKENDRDFYRTVQYAGCCQEFPVYRCGDAEYFPCGEKMFRKMLLELSKAEEYIFLEYFIIEPGIMWDALLEILKEKAKAGVEVRVLYDGTCNFNLLPGAYPKTLEAFGIKVRVFSPILPVLSTHQNNRNHRKHLIIDGRIAFLGGINLADEYINERKRFGYWKDTGVMISGEGVRTCVSMFLQMWNLNHRRVTPDHYAKYFKRNSLAKSNGFVMPYGDSPYSYDQIGEQVYLDLLNQAQSYVFIMTPYLILDDQLLHALRTAAKRGVDVRIIMPHIPDKRYVFALSRSYYPELLGAGVKIYEFRPGFVHAKVFLSDDEKAVVGSINLDYRSLYLNFENAVYLSKVDCICDIREDFEETFSQCIMVTKDIYKGFAVGSRLIGRVLRLIAPLM